MEVRFKNRKLAKVFKDYASLEREYGVEMTRKIRDRFEKLKEADNLGDFWPPYSRPDRCHEMTGSRKGQLSVDLKHPRRLFFVPDHNPVPERSEGGLDWGQVTRIIIVAVEDPH